MKIKSLVAAVALAAVSNVSLAAIANATFVEGELFLTVFDPSAQTSYHLDLGIDISAMNSDRTSTRTFDLTGDANFSTFIGQTDLRYAVTGADVSFNDINTYGLMATAIAGLDAVVKAIPNDAFINPIAIRMLDEAGRLNAQGPEKQPFLLSNRTVNTSAFAKVGDIGYYGVARWGDTIGNSGFTAAQNVDQSVGFYQAQLSQVDYDSAVISEFAGTWLLTSAGTLEYSVAASVVPVPAAVWLFGSGLIGLAGIARRKKA